MSNKVRKKKKSSVREIDNVSVRASRKAASIIKEKSSKIGLIGGTPFDECALIGIEEVTRGMGSTDFKISTVRHMERLLSTRRCTWTCVVAFFNDEEDGITVASSSKQFVNTIPSEFDNDATDYLYEESLHEWSEDTYASIWVAIPAEIDAGEDVISEFDDFLEDSKVFEPSTMRDILNKRQMSQVLTIGDMKGTPLHTLALSIRDELNNMGKGVAIRLSHHGKLTETYTLTDGSKWSTAVSRKGLLVYWSSDDKDVTKDLVSEVAIPLIDDSCIYQCLPEYDS